MGTVYDCRKSGREPGSISFPCAVRILDPATGERLANVFYAATDPPRVGRFVLGPAGEPLVNPLSRRKVWVDNGRGGKKLEIVYDRMELWERRRWVAVRLDGGGVVAKSEGVS